MTCTDGATYEYDVLVVCPGIKLDWDRTEGCWASSFPLIDPTKPHRGYWYLKKYGLPFMYWNLMLGPRLAIRLPTPRHCHFADNG